MTDTFAQHELEKYTSLLAASATFVEEGQQPPEEIVNSLKEIRAEMGQLTMIEDGLGIYNLKRIIAEFNRCHRIGFTGASQYDNNGSPMFVNSYEGNITRRIIYGNKTYDSLEEKMAKWILRGRNLEHARMRIIAKSPESLGMLVGREPIDVGSQLTTAEKSRYRKRHEEEWKRYADKHRSQDIRMAENIAEWFVNSKRPWEVINPHPTRLLWNGQTFTGVFQQIRDEVNKQEAEINIYQADQVSTAEQYMEAQRRRRVAEVPFDKGREFEEEIDFINHDEAYCTEERDGSYRLLVRRHDQIIETRTEGEIDLSGIIRKILKKSRVHVSAWTSANSAEAEYQKIVGRIEKTKRKDRIRTRKGKFLKGDSESIDIVVEGNNPQHYLLVRAGKRIIECRSVNPDDIKRYKNELRRLYNPNNDKRKKDADKQRTLKRDLEQALGLDKTPTIQTMQLAYQDMDPGRVVSDRSMADKPYQESDFRMHQEQQTQPYKNTFKQPDTEGRVIPFDAQIRLNIVYEGKTVEVQIRTPYDHYRCEVGELSHSGYKSERVSNISRREQQLIEFIRSIKD